MAFRVCWMPQTNSKNEGRKPLFSFAVAEKLDFEKPFIFVSRSPVPAKNPHFQKPLFFAFPFWTLAIFPHFQKLLFMENLRKISDFRRF